MENPVKFAFFPIMIHAFDIVVSAVGIMVVKAGPRDDEEGFEANPMDSLKKGYVVALVLAFCEFVGTTRWLLYTESAPTAWMSYSCCT